MVEYLHNLKYIFSVERTIIFFPISVRWLITKSEVVKLIEEAVRHTLKVIKI